MPGFNQRGPMNDGPMTGRGRGVCNGNMSQGQGFGGGGYGRGLGCRGGQAAVRRYGRGSGWAGPGPLGSIRESLEKRTDILEAELSEIKNQLHKLTESRESL